MTDPSLLVTGDLHLGRHPTRVPAELDGQQFSPAAVWRATVDAALERDVDAVLVSGDVVDRENRYVEAYGDFERGAARLADAGVPLLAVAGNHDHDVLPELVDSLDHDGVHLLGAEGSWERRVIERGGEPVCVVDGWSFPSEHVLTNPLEAYDPDALAAEVSETDDAPDADEAPVADHAPDTVGAPVVGLLHADLDARDSDYAPVSTADLREQSADAWILGHVHAPGVRVESDPLVCYPGSPQPLDPGEPGAHGPWLLDVAGSGSSAGDSAGGRAAVTAEQLPLATLRYDELTVDVGGAEATTDVAPAVHDRVEEHVRDAVPADRLEFLLARTRLRGRTPIHADLHDERSRIEEQLGVRRQGLDVGVERVELDTRPAIDLERWTGDETPVAYLAELLLALEDGEQGAVGEESEQSAAGQDGRQDHAGRDAEVGLADEHARLVDDVLERLREACGASAYTRLREEGRIDQPDRSDAVEVLTRQARLLLDELLEQREERA